MPLTRRTLIGTPLAVLPLLVAARRVKAGQSGAALEALERRVGGRLGVAVIDTAGGEPLLHRGDERFALCSTWKALAAGFVLARVERGAERLDRRVVYGRDALVAYAPVAEKHVGGDGLSVNDLCAAAVTLSDNAAANLLLDGFGGPAALTAWLRSSGDAVTRLDRREPALNDVPPGDSRDTTSPRAMAETLRRLVLGPVLEPASRERLAGWLVGCRTGDRRIRAGVPAGWRVGDKTGTWRQASTSDVAVIWPPARAPLIVTAYYDGVPGGGLDRDAVLAEVGWIACA